MRKQGVIAIAGNPNIGKSTVFNSLTGAKQEIGNWPGKTVEKRAGKLKRRGESYEVVDLPGTYGLSAYSSEELIARDFLVEEKPEVVIDVVDASNLERNLYLTVQLMELGVKLVIALNMTDVSRDRGVEIDSGKLSGLLGIPVVPTIANKGTGISALIEEAVRIAESEKRDDFRIDYGKTLEPKIQELEDHIKRHASALASKYGARWLAVKLVENDTEVIGRIRKADSDIYDREFERFVKDAGEIYGEDVDVEIADRRYGFINGLTKLVVSRNSPPRVVLSDQIDTVMTNRYLGVPIFLLIMYAVYQLVFMVGYPFVELLRVGMGWFAGYLGNSLLFMNAPEWISGFLLVGVLGGIGNVLVFVPNIALLFLSIAILEDSGYMARAAFVMDGIMGRIGLRGKSFIPMVIGFGCSVPGIMATRGMGSERDRVLTMLVTFLVPCSARMAVFVFLAGTFFEPGLAAQAIWSLVVLSLLLVLGVGWVFSRFLFRGEGTPFVMELPPYQKPTPKGIALHTWERTRAFVTSAGKFIFLVAIIIWFLASYPSGAEYGSGESYIGQLGHLLSPLFSPLGFDWRATVALVMGFFAKEVIISAFAVLYEVPGQPLGTTLAGMWTPLQAYAFMVFTLIYAPCIATVATIKQETNSWKWTGFAVGYGLVLAWAMAFLVLQLGAFLGY